MNAQEARETLQASRQKPNLVAQVVPSPITFTWDATIQKIVQDQTLGELIYVEVLSTAQFCSRSWWAGLVFTGHALQVRGQSGTTPQPTGSTMTWRQDVDLSGLNVMKLGIFYEALQRSALLLRSVISVCSGMRRSCEIMLT